MTHFLSDVLFFIVCLFILCAAVAVSFLISRKILKFFKNGISKLFTDTDQTKTVQVKALKFYAAQRAIILISTFSVIGYITIHKPTSVVKNIWIFPTCLLIICVSMFYTYLVIVEPLFKEGEKHGAEYKKNVNDYRKDMNIVFTLFFLTTFMIAIVSYLLPTEMDKEIIGLSKWLTIPLFSSGIIYLIGAEKKLEDIYCVYYTYEYYESDVIKLL